MADHAEDPAARAAEALGLLARRGLMTMTAQGPLLALVPWIAGGPVRGSWWSHPRGKEIFRVATALAGHADLLACKLVAGKITFVHRALWPALLRLANDPARRAAATARLDAGARRLLARVDQAGELHLDEEPAEGPAERRARKQSVAALEAALLVLSGSEHTEGGHHAAVLTSWERWARDRGLGRRALPDADAAREALRSASAGEPCPLVDQAATPAAGARRHRR